MSAHNRDSGFTLIEIVITMVLLGILAGVLAPMFVSSMDAYSDTAARNELTARGRLALERLARELRLAVPNSVRIVANAGGNPGLEFVTSKIGGRYIDNGDRFNSADYTFRFRPNANLAGIDLLGTAYNNWVNTDFIVIGNYTPVTLQAGTTTAQLAAGPVDTDRDGDGINEVQNLAFAGGEQFSFSSPTNQYQIADNTHEVGLNGTSIRWLRTAGITGYDGAGDWGGANAILVNADVLAVTFNLTFSLLRIDLALTENGETVNLSQEIQVRNTP